MDSNQKLEIWTRLSRLDDINEALKFIAHHLQKIIDFDGIMIRRFDPHRSQMDTIADFVFYDVHDSIDRHTKVSSEGIAWLMSEVAYKKPLDHYRGHTSKLVTYGFLPSGLNVDSVGLSLGQPASEKGIIIIYSHRPNIISKEHSTYVTDIVEPASMVFRNCERIHTLSVLKEAAETDRDSLLVKFGRAEIGDIVIGGQKGLKSVMERVSIIAKSDLPILIFGETGSGKEVIARAIHQQSQRNGLPFIRVNCGAIPPDLIDSELFGHERGSFTGAIESRQGWFERADRGTLFLDEIGELPLAAQVRLLRVLQDGTFERIGGRVQRTCDVRIVAATHRNLVEMVGQGSFREDLWYRLSAFPVYLPPLRDRKEDIPDLANHFIHKAALRFGLPYRMPTDDDLKLLIQYPWPGNVRELSTVIDRATILGKGVELKIEAALGTFGHVTPKDNGRHNILDENQRDMEVQTLDQIIIDHIRSVLKKTNGVVDGDYGAASLLGLNPNTLRSKMRKYGVKTHTFK
jgi:hydrogenase-4 transcriptional activator